MTSRTNSTHWTWTYAAIWLGCTAAATAQVTAPAPQDAAQAEAQIERVLRTTGNLEPLVLAWQDAPPAARATLALHRGALEQVLPLWKQARDAATSTTLSVHALDLRSAMIEDALGNEARALELFLACLDSAVSPEEDFALVQRIAALQVDLRDRPAARATLRDGIARLQVPDGLESDRLVQLANFAASLGMPALALEIVDASGELETASAAKVDLHRMLRAHWRERAARTALTASIDDALILIASSLDAWMNAATTATSDRNARFAWARALAVASIERPATLQDRRDDQDTLDSLKERLEEFAAPTSAQWHAWLAVMRRTNQESEAKTVIEARLLQTDDPERRATLHLAALEFTLSQGDPTAAVARAATMLEEQPGNMALRVTHAVLLGDLRRREEADLSLRDGLDLTQVAGGARARSNRRRLIETASRLSLTNAVAHGVALVQQLEGTIPAALLNARVLADHDQKLEAFNVLRAAGEFATTPGECVQLAESLKGLGHLREALALYRQAYALDPTEDQGTRLAWLLSNSTDPSDRADAETIWRDVWLRATSRGRRAQAAERVLQAAATNGTLADLAVELETFLDDPRNAEDPTMGAKREALVEIWNRAGDPSGAAAILRAQAKVQGHEINARRELARVWLQHARYQEFEATIEDLLALDPERGTEYRRMLATSALERGRPRMVRDMVEELVTANDDPSTLEFAAGLLDVGGMAEAAIPLYRRVAHLDASRVETWLLLGKALMESEAADRARGTFASLLQEDVSDDLLLVAVDGLLDSRTPPPMLRGAVRAMRRRLAANPLSVHCHRALQDLLAAMDRDVDRITDLETTLVIAGLQRTAYTRERMDEALQQGDTTAYLDHGRILLASGDEVPPQVFLRLGETLLQQGEAGAREARRAFERARLAPDFEAMETRVAALYERSGDLWNAERLRRRILGRAPNNAVAMAHVARLVEQRGDLPVASSLFLDAARAALLAKSSQAAGTSTDFATRNQSESATEATWHETVTGLLRTTRGESPLVGELLQDYIANIEASPPIDAAWLPALRTLQQLRAAAALDTTWLARSAALEQSAAAAHPDVARALFAWAMERGDLQAAERLARGGSSFKLELLRSLDDAGGNNEILSTEGLEKLEQRITQIVADADVEQSAAAARMLSLAHGAHAAIESLRSTLRNAAEEAPLLARAAWKRVASLAIAPPTVAEPTSESGEADAATRGWQAAWTLRDEDRSLRHAALARSTTTLTQLLATADASGQVAMGQLVAQFRTTLTWMRKCPDLVATDLTNSVKILADTALRIDDQDLVLTWIRLARTTCTPQVLANLATHALNLAKTPRSAMAIFDLLPTETAIARSQQAWPATDARTSRPMVLRYAANRTLPPRVRAAWIEQVDLGDPNLATTLRISALATNPNVEPEVATVLLTSLLRDDPQSRSGPALKAVLRAHLATSEATRLQALLQAATGLRADSLSRRTAPAVIARIASLATPPMIERMLRLPTREAVDFHLRAALLDRRGEHSKATDALVNACKRQPESTSHLQDTARRLDSEGRFEEAAALYDLHVAAVPVLRPYQAQQAASRYLGLANHSTQDARQAAVEHALRVLDQVSSKSGYHATTALLTLSLLQRENNEESTSERMRRFRRWLQEETNRKRGLSSQATSPAAIIDGILDATDRGANRSTFFLAKDAVAQSDPGDANAWESLHGPGDLLRLFNEQAPQLGEAWLRSLPLAERRTRPDIVRGMGAADLKGDAADIAALAAARTERTTHSLETTNNAALRAFLRHVPWPERATLELDPSGGQDANPSLAVDAWLSLQGRLERAKQSALIAAPSAPHDASIHDGQALASRALADLLIDRDAARRLSSKDREALLQHAAMHDPGRLLLLLPEAGETLTDDFDGALLQALLVATQTRNLPGASSWTAQASAPSAPESGAQASRQSVAAVFADGLAKRMARTAFNEANVDSRILLGISGFALRAGDMTAAMNALRVNDRALERGNLPPAADFTRLVPASLGSDHRIELAKQVLAEIPIARQLGRHGRATFCARIVVMLIVRLPESAAVQRLALVEQLKNATQGLLDSRTWMHRIQAASSDPNQPVRKS